MDTVMEMQAPRRLGLRWTRRDTGVLLLALALAALVLYPVGMLLYGSLHSEPPGTPGHISLDGWRRLFGMEEGQALWNSITLAFSNTLISLPVALTMAWLVVRSDMPGRGALEILITMPFFIPPVVTAAAWGMLGNAETGTVNQVWRWATGAEAPLVNVYSRGGIVWAMVQLSIPFQFLFIADALRNMDASLEEASRMSGAGPWRTFISITAVALTPVLSSGFVLSIVRGIESFESALIFGSPAGIEVLATRVYDAINQQTPPDYQLATALGFAMMAGMMPLLLLQWKLIGSKSFHTVSGKGLRATSTGLGAWRWPAFAFCLAFVFLSLLLPLGQVAAGSFFRFAGFYSWDALTLDHYRNVLADDAFWRALANTAWLGLLGASLVMALGVLVAYVCVRTNARGKRLLEILAWCPWMMPGVVLGIGLLWGLALLPRAVSPYGTPWALLVAYVILCLPVSVRLMSGVFAQISKDLEECSRVHGASWGQTLRRILMALVWPAFATGWIMAFFAILRELSASIMLYSPGSEVLSVVMLKLWSRGEAEEVSVIALILVAAVLVFRWVQLACIERRLRTKT